MYLEHVRDINHSIHLIEENMLRFNAKQLLKMFTVFKEMTERYALIHNSSFSEAFGNYNLERMMRHVEKAQFANEIITEYL